MPIKMYWGDEGHSIFCWYFEGNWTWEEFHYFMPEAVVAQRRTGHRVDIIMDMRNTDYLPPAAVTHVRQALAAMPDNIGHLVVVGPNVFVKAALSTFRSLYKETSKKFIVAETMEEAESLIYAQR
jgi:hypothetical protein